MSLGGGAFRRVAGTHLGGLAFRVAALGGLLTRSSSVAQVVDDLAPANCRRMSRAHRIVYNALLIIISTVLFVGGTHA